MIDRERLEDLVLARLSVETKSRPSPSDVLNGLFPYVENQLTRTEWRGELDRTLATLRERGALEPKRLTLTPSGHERVAAALGMDSVPQVRSWAEFKKRYLPALIDPEDSSGLRGGHPALALVARGLGLQLEHVRSEGAVANAWIAAALGIDERSVTLDSLRAALLARELGVPVRRSLRDVIRLSATKLSGAKSARPEDIAKSATTRWLRGKRESAKGSTAPSARVTCAPTRAPSFGTRPQQKTRRSSSARCGTGSRFAFLRLANRVAGP